MDESGDLIEEISEEFASFIINPSDFSQIRLIGRGGYAEVWLARNKRTNEEVAMKQLFTTLQPKQIQSFGREVKTMATANHPFFLKFLGFSTKRPLSILTEYMPNGSLLQFLRSESRRERLTPTHRTLIAMAIASAMDSLHKLGIIHRDLKSPNILLDKDLLPRLADFGIARYIDTDTVTMRLGTPQWMAPEMFNGDGYGPKVDVYSFGMLLYELLTNSLPWTERDATVVMMHVIEGERPKLPGDAPKPLARLIEMCWDKNPKRRPKFKEIYEMFANREVEFEGTEEDGVAWMVKQLDKWSQEQKEKGGREKRRKGSDRKQKKKGKESDSEDEEAERKKRKASDREELGRKRRKESAGEVEEMERKKRKASDREEMDRKKRRLSDTDSEEAEREERKKRKASDREEMDRKKRRLSDTDSEEAEREERKKRKASDREEVNRKRRKLSDTDSEDIKRDERRKMRASMKNEPERKRRDESDDEDMKKKSPRRSQSERNVLEYSEKKQKKDWYMQYANSDSEEEEADARPKKSKYADEKSKKRKRYDYSEEEEEPRMRPEKRRKSSSGKYAEQTEPKKRKWLISSSSDDQENVADDRKRKDYSHRKTGDPKEIRRLVKAQEIYRSDPEESPRSVKSARTEGERDQQWRRRTLAAKKPVFFREEEDERSDGPSPRVDDRQRLPPKPPKPPQASRKLLAPGIRDPHSLDGSRKVELTPDRPPVSNKDPLSFDGRRITFEEPANRSRLSRSTNFNQPMIPPPARQDPGSEQRIKPLRLDRELLGRSQPLPDSMFVAPPPRKKMTASNMSPSAAMNQPSPGRSVILKDLESLKNPRFRWELANAVINVTDAQLEEFTNLLANYFRAETPVREMDFILANVAVFVKKPKSATSFVYHNLHLQLPFDQEELVDRCFDVVLALFQTVPALFHDEYVGQLKQMIQISPKKSIVILAYYAQAFELVKGPFPILDLMLSASKTFFRANVGAELVSVLFYLCSSFESYKSFRVTECIQQVFVKGLESKDVETIKASYYSLHHHFTNSVSLDPGTITDHLCNEETSDAALDFLVKLRQVPATDEMISAIVALGYYEERATLILIRLAHNFDSAVSICRDQHWVACPFPTFTHTLQLLLVIFSHEQFKGTVQLWPETLSLYDSVCRERDSMKLASVAIMIRKMGVTKQFMKLLVSRGILKNFLETAKAIDDSLAQNAALKVLETLGNIDFAPEYLLYADKIKQLLSLENHTSALAVTVIATLSRYPLCAKKFVDLKLEPYFRKLEQNETYRKTAKEFLKNISVQDYY